MTDIDYNLLKEAKLEDQILHINEIEEELELLKDKSSEVEEHTYFEIAKNILSSAIPATCGLLFIFLTETINIMIIGKHNLPVLIAAIGLGTLYVNATGYIPGIGLLGGIDTLCSQAYGQKNYVMIGNYASIGRASITIFFLFISIPMNFLSYYILQYIGIDEEICVYASHYCHAMSVSVFLNLHFQTSLRYLNSMNNFLPGMVITLATAVFHPLWCYLLVNTFDFGIIGAGLSIGFTQLLNLILVSLYIHIKNPCPESYFYISEYTLKLKPIFNYLRKAIPAAIMYSADWIGFEILTFMASFLGPVPLAANVCLFNFITIIFMLQIGLAMATTTLVGNSVGAENHKNVTKYSVTSIVIGACIMMCTTTLVLVFRADIPGLYTDENEVKNLFYKLLGIYVIFAIPDSIQMVLHGIIKGLGKQKWASVACLIVLYPINITFAYFLAFHLKIGVMGLWYSQMSAVILLVIIYCIIYFKTDVNEVIHEARKILESKRNSKSTSNKSKN